MTFTFLAWFHIVNWCCSFVARPPLDHTHYNQGERCVSQQHWC